MPQQYHQTAGELNGFIEIAWASSHLLDMDCAQRDSGRRNVGFRHVPLQQENVLKDKDYNVWMSISATDWLGM